MNPIIGLIRHILTFAGGYFVATGKVSEIEVQEIIAGLVTITGVIWSIAEKRKVPKIPDQLVPLILIPFVLAFTLLPSGCVEGPNGEVQLNPHARDLMENAAKVAVMIGVSHATAGVSELAPYTGVLSRGITKIFDETEDPRGTGEQLRELFSNIALEIGNEALTEYLLEYVTDELVPEVPAAGPDGGRQFRYNSEIATGLNEPGL